MNKRFTFNDNGSVDTIKNFTCKCAECSSSNVEIYYEFNYYGGMTGYDYELTVKCHDCENKQMLIWG